MLELICSTSLITKVKPRKPVQEGCWALDIHDHHQGLASRPA